MSTDAVFFPLFVVPLVAFVAAWVVFFGKRNGAIRMPWREVLIIEAGLLVLALASTSSLAT